MRTILLYLTLLTSFALAAPTAVPSVVVVQRGDTLYSVARAYGLSVAQLRALNNLRGNELQLGQQLRVSGMVQIVPTTPSKVGLTLGRPGSAASSGYHVVQRGDTLHSLSRRYGLSVWRLQQLNQLRSAELKIGQRLRISLTPLSSRPVAAPKPVTASPQNPAYHRVQPGETLHQLAQRYGVNVPALLQLNRLNGQTIQVGQYLRIPPRGTWVRSTGRLTLQVNPNAPARPKPSQPQAKKVPKGQEVRTVYRYIRVPKGMTGALIAQRYQVKPVDLAQLNRLSSANAIVPGMKLLVPQRMAVPVPPAPKRAAVTYRRARPLGIAVQIVQVDLRHRDVLVQPVLPSRGLRIGSGARVSTLAKVSGAQALVNGGYFHPSTFAPAGDIVMQGKMLAWGRIPAALAITPDNRAYIRKATTSRALRPYDDAWSGMETVIAAGPYILTKGRVQSGRGSVFRDPAVFRRAARSAIGLKNERDLLLVTTSAQLSVTQMAKVMAALGAKDALLLDGGSSTGMAWKGSTTLDSIRRVSFGIGVFTNYEGRRYAR